MRLRAIALAGVLALGALLAPAARGGAAEDYSAIKQDWVANGADAGPGITPCRFRQEQIASARTESQNNADDNYTGFRDALQREYDRQQAGACASKEATPGTQGAPGTHGTAGTQETPGRQGTRAAGATPTAAQAVKLPSGKKCIGRKVVRLRFMRPPGSAAVKRIQISLNGRLGKVVQGFVPTAAVNLKKLPAKRFTVKVTLTYANGKKLAAVRKYKPCSKAKTKPKKPKR